MTRAPNDEAPLTAPVIIATPDVEADVPRKAERRDHGPRSDGADTSDGSAHGRSGTGADGATPGSSPNGVQTPVVKAVPLPEEDMQGEEEVINLKMTWGGKSYDLVVGVNETLQDLLPRIDRLTHVPPNRQKLIGTKFKLGPSSASKTFGALGVKDGTKFVMVGTPESATFKDPGEMSLPEIVDDFDIAYSKDSKASAAQPLPLSQVPKYKRMLQEKIQRVPLNFMETPRPGKRLLVLDLDYTIIDTRPLLDGALPADECVRPGLHEFLELVYPHYDIAVWSQTHWRWLESKLVEIGMIGGDRQYKVCFVADRSSMFPVQVERDGQPYQHEVKPLAYFWAAHSGWSDKNTIHIDDLSRNFALNPGEGLKIRAFKGAGTAEGLGDRELRYLGRYLTGLAERCDDFTLVDHADWKRLARSAKKQAAAPPQDGPDPGPDASGTSTGSGSGSGPAPDSQ